MIGHQPQCRLNGIWGMELGKMIKIRCFLFYSEKFWFRKWDNRKHGWVELGRQVVIAMVESQNSNASIKKALFSSRKIVWENPTVFDDRTSSLDSFNYENYGSSLYCMNLDTIVGCGYVSTCCIHLIPISRTRWHNKIFIFLIIFLPFLG